MMINQAALAPATTAEQRVMAAALKKVSSNLHRFSKEKGEPEAQKASLPSSNFSLASRSAVSKSKSREKSETNVNKAIKSSLLEKIKKSQAAGLEDPGLKKPSFYSMLKKSSKENAERKILESRGTPTLLLKAGLESKASARVLQLIKNNYVAARTSKDPSSRESSKSVQKSAKEKSLKSKKSANDLKKSQPAKPDQLEVHNILFKGLISDKPKSAAKSVSASAKDRKNTNSVSEKGDSQQTAPTKKSLLTRRLKTENGESTSIRKSSQRFDLANKEPGHHITIGKSHAGEGGSKEKNGKLVDMFKKMSLQEKEDSARKLEDAKPKAKKEDPYRDKLEPKPFLQVTDQEVRLGTKKAAKLAPSITVKPSALSFKDFGAGLVTIAAGPSPGPSPNLNAKKSKKSTSGKRSPQLVDKEKDKRSTSGKRGAQLLSNVHVFSNNYLISHVHQVNNIYK